MSQGGASHLEEIPEEEVVSSTPPFIPPSPGVSTPSPKSLLTGEQQQKKRNETYGDESLSVLPPAISKQTRLEAFARMMKGSAHPLAAPPASKSESHFLLYALGGAALIGIGWFLNSGYSWFFSKSSSWKTSAKGAGKPAAIADVPAEIP